MPAVLRYVKTAYLKLMFTAIYVGKPMTQVWPESASVFIDKAGWVNEMSINFGVTGWCFSLSQGFWDFRSHEANISFKVMKRDLKFLKEIT